MNHNKTRLFKHLRQLQEMHLGTITASFEKMNYEVLAAIRHHDRISGKDLAEIMDISEEEVRHHILDIRLNFHKYANPSNREFILADVNGYFLSSDRHLKRQYLKMLKKASIKKSIQALELEFTF